MRRSAVVLAVGGAAVLGLTLAPPPNMAAPTRASNSSSIGDFSSASYATVRHGVRRANARGDARRIWARPRRINVPIGRLRIKAIGLDAPIRNGIHNRVVRLGPGLWPGTPLPGTPGNAVIAGHRTTFTHPFRDLNHIRRGHVVRVRLRGRHWVAFKVFSKKVVRESRYVSFVLRQPRRATSRLITLFACTPKGQRTHRIVVRAKARRADVAEKEGADG